LSWLRQAILKKRIEQRELDLDDLRNRFMRQKSYQAMILDFIASITHVGSEGDAIRRILDLFSMLFGPERIAFASIREGMVDSCAAMAGPEPEIAECQAWLDESQAPEADSSEDSYTLMRISYQGELYGILMIENLIVNGHRSEYHELAKPLAHICGLALFNARMYQDIERLAVTDSLTGLFNRRQFFLMAENEFVRSKRYGRPISAIMVNVDLFKHVNDVYGHKAGDEVLSTSRNMPVVIEPTSGCPDRICSIGH
jgi:hypothetical protein